MIEENDEISVVPQVMLLEQVLSDIAQGRLRIPMFQRPFVWRPEQMRTLFDSIERGYPIGSLLVWQTEAAVPSLGTVADFDVRQRSPGSTVSYLLDGHQRMSTLFGCLWRGPDTNAKRDWKWRIYRALGRPTTDGDRFQHWQRRGDTSEPPAHLLPMSAILRTTDFLSYSRRLYDSRVSDPERLMEEAEELAHRIKSYQVALVQLRGGSLRHAVEAFSRLNTTGQTMSPDQMISALTYDPQGESLANRIAVIRENLGAVGYGQIPAITVFRTVLAIAGEEDVQATRWEALAERVNAKLDKAVVATELALQHAVTFLRETVGVPLVRLVPYQPQVMLLATFFHLQPAPSVEQSRELVRWFWGTSWSGHFAGANTTDIKTALRDMKVFAKGQVDRPWKLQQARPFPNRFDLRSARVRAFVLWELKTHPERLTAHGTKFDPVRILTASDSDAYRHVVSRGPVNVAHPANRVILPTTEGVSIRAALTSLTGKLRDRVLAGHGIPTSALTRLAAGDGEGFIAERAAALIAHERQFMARVGIEPSDAESGEAEIDTE